MKKNKKNEKTNATAPANSSSVDAVAGIGSQNDLLPKTSQISPEYEELSYLVAVTWFDQSLNCRALSPINPSVGSRENVLWACSAIQKTHGLIKSIVPSFWSTGEFCFCVVLTHLEEDEICLRQIDRLLATMPTF